MFFKRNNETPRIRLAATPFINIGASAQVEDSKKILIVDDDPVILKTLSFTLQSSGYQVVTATDAAEAMSQARSERPDLLIVDIFLAADPVGCGALGWDGFQFARWIHGPAPIIIISGSEKPEYQSQTTAAGAQAFLTKPISNKLLLGTVAELLAAKKPVAAGGN